MSESPAIIYEEDRRIVAEWWAALPGSHYPLYLVQLDPIVSHLARLIRQCPEPQPPTIDQQAQYIAWLESELERYQSHGCLTVIDRLRNQADRIGLLEKAIDEASGKLREAMNV